MRFVLLKITVTENFSKLMFFFWLQTQMNAKALKQMSVTPMLFVPILKDSMCVAAWKVMKAMEEIVQVTLGPRTFF